ncbi:Class II abasic (AP) endonuclease [Polyrhizophydium stewartii]|uniref:DNA-(apurinic or apyrimidinic site) endonuclease n=1 Tax=Polyrhizophydium stewartii TaxID=2732419 RepID=A0ABR4N278_9FUNG
MGDEPAASETPPPAQAPAEAGSDADHKHQAPGGSQDEPRGSQRGLRLLSWNVNGARTLRQHAQWSGCRTFGEVVAALDADIVCLQEVKVARRSIPHDIAIVPGFDVFFSFSKKRDGYSGTATFVRSTLRPADAEEGLSGLHGGAGAAPSGGSVAALSSGMIAGMSRDAGQIHESLRGRFTVAELHDLDSEGRVVITDHGLFVVMNIYFPNESSEERQGFKQRFLEAVELRARWYLNGDSAGATQGARTTASRPRREVVIAGDFNISHRPIDHCDPVQSMRDHGLREFGETPSRRWLSRMLAPQGPMTDTFRHFHPQQAQAFTCWNTLIDARRSNFGTRIDYILVSSGVVPAICAGSILAQVMGSDHAPVQIEFEERHAASGDLVERLLGGAGGAAVERAPPRLCSSRWPEFSGPNIKQLLTRSASDGSQAPADRLEPGKRSIVGVVDTTVQVAVKRTKPSGGKQLDLLSYMQRRVSREPRATEPASDAPFPGRDAGPEARCSGAMDAAETRPLPERASTVAAWRGLFEKPKAPLCHHGEPCQEWTVKKAGPTKGRVFYLCARPVGPSGQVDEDGRRRHRGGRSADGADGQADDEADDDDGEAADGGVSGTARRRGGRRGAEAAGEWRCDFFAWKTAARVRAK